METESRRRGALLRVHDGEVAEKHLLPARELLDQPLLLLLLGPPLLPALLAALVVSILHLASLKSPGAPSFKSSGGPGLAEGCRPASLVWSAACCLRLGCQAKQRLLYRN